MICVICKKEIAKSDSIKIEDPDTGKMERVCAKGHEEYIGLVNHILADRDAYSSSGDGMF